jgi:hypothetical protein
MSNESLITVITPTTGKPGILKLIDSLIEQETPVEHILLWDDMREGEFLYPSLLTNTVLHPDHLKGVVNEKAKEHYSLNNIIIKGSMVQGSAAGSALRAVGLMAAKTPYVAFADDDTWVDSDHYEKLLKAIDGKKWAYTLRRIWEDNNNEIGVDRFESIGDKSDLPYDLVDNNCMLVSRRYGTSAAVLYRETKEYNDDRLMYSFLKEHAGEPGETDEATVNQICPQRLIRMFEANCSEK